MNPESKITASSEENASFQSANLKTEETICAVIVTYNRKAMLLGCLESLLKQSYPIDAIYLIDNASSDGTPELILEKGYIKTILLPNGSPLESESEVQMQSEGLEGKKVRFHYVRMNKNTGGAGGFYEGIKRSYQKGYDWFWLMDDDVVVTTTALIELMKFKEILESKKEDYSFLCSKVVGRSGTLINVPRIDRRVSKNGYADWALYLEYGAAQIRSLTFISVIFNRKNVFEKGLPIKEFFIWAEDREYGLRLSQDRPGYLVGRSLAVHLREIETNLNITKEMDKNRIKYYAHLFRNHFYIYSKYGGLKKAIQRSTKEKGRMIKAVIKHKGPYKILKILTIMRGTLSGLFFHPKIDFLDKK